MLRHSLERFGAACFAALVALAPPAALAGSSASEAPSDVPSNAALVATLLRTDSFASFESGCFPPCSCFVQHTSALRGTLSLSPAGSNASGRLVFAVRDVNWLITLAGADTRVVGSGVFEITNPATAGPLPHTQRMILTLSIGGQGAQVFDSGVVHVVRPFPALDVTVSMNNMVCTDTVFRVAMSPVPASALRPYRLTQSTLQEGCFIGCACPIVSRPLGGVFSLVPLAAASAAPGPNAAQEWAVVALDFAVANASPAIVPPAHARITGAGIYKRTTSAGAIPVLAHRMWLDVNLPPSNTAPPNTLPRVALDSGLVPAPSAFPNIDIRLADRMFQCYNRVFDLHARPVASTTPITD